MSLGPGAQPHAEGPEEYKLTASEEQVKAALHKQILNGANWFYWIAGLSVVNTVMTFTGSDRAFLLGLMYTQLVDYIAKAAGAAGTAVPLIADAAIIGVFAFIGYKAGSGLSKSAFWTGMVVYGIDGLLCVLGQGWFQAGFHGLALYYIYRGLTALGQLRQMELARLAVPGLSSVRTD